MRRVKVAVPMQDAKLRALKFLQSNFQKGLMPANGVAYSIWPQTQFTSQGAGGAASRILRVLQKEGHVKWDSNDYNWGWKITSAGRVWLGKNI